ncbi:hypothetical protein CN495_29530 [Bacillus thuringiensis]|uniref:Uncharacterized protein n=1 Tax=Bacillus thuringiensis TaxID=1428 RepID=A0ABD6RXW0_BACTU|nr:hypothetical protein CN495_29530 [Bacillus thuringiensis]PEU81134.1 hypothetical protein CN411_24680 [Bacillus thuringiensis]PGY64911.1 hypothetical protein COE44_30185 [Bacillus thuringiensis]
MKQLQKLNNNSFDSFLILNEICKNLKLVTIGYVGCGESLLHSLFLCLNLFFCVKTDKKGKG